MEQQILPTDDSSNVLVELNITPGASGQPTRRSSPRLRAVMRTEDDSTTTAATTERNSKGAGGANRRRRRPGKVKSIHSDEAIANSDNVEPMGPVASTRKSSRKRPRPSKSSEVIQEGAREETMDLELGATVDAGSTTTPGQKSARRKKRTPYSKKTWLEQKELLDHEAERAKRVEEQEQKRLQRLPSLEKLSAAKLNKVRPNAPRNTTQFLIDSHEQDDDVSLDQDAIQIDEHGSMTAESSDLIALGEELRKRALSVTSMS